jgi:ferric-dicitrate binding protein FerR (iron transport regulator)
MRFLQLYAYTLLLGGPIVGYRIATRWMVPRRRHVMAFCAAGGAAGAVVLIATLLLTEMTPFAAVRHSALPFIGRYALVGLGLGLVSVVAPESIRHRLIVSCARFAKQIWRHRGQVLVATFGTVLIDVTWVWLRPHVFPAPSSYVHVDAPRRSARTTRLPDESQVILAAGSHLSYTDWFKRDDERDVTLNGQGTFTVARGARNAMSVRGAGVEVSASNARFTIHAKDNEPVAYVIVHEGRAEVRARSPYGHTSRSLTLSAGEGARVGPKFQIVRDTPLPLHP